MDFVGRFKKLSPALRAIAAVASFSGSLAGIVALYLSFNPFTNFNPDVIGRWYSSYSYPITGGSLYFDGRTDLFPEGKYNVSGTVIIEGKAQGEFYKYAYNVVGAGTWMADKEHMQITLQNMRSSTSFIEVAGMRLGPQLVEKLLGKPAPELSDAYPGGMSDNYNIEAVSPKIVVLRAVDPFGKSFEIKMKRQL